jgi:hypothetical protein
MFGKGSRPPGYQQYVNCAGRGSAVPIPILSGKLGMDVIVQSAKECASPHAFRMARERDILSAALFTELSFCEVSNSALVRLSGAHLGARDVRGECHAGNTNTQARTSRSKAGQVSFHSGR